MSGLVAALLSSLPFFPVQPGRDEKPGLARQGETEKPSQKEKKSSIIVFPLAMGRARKWAWGRSFIFNSGSVWGFNLLALEGNGTPLQYSSLENPMDGGAWWAAVHGVAEGRTRLSDFTFTFHFHALEKDMATRSSLLAWRIPGKGKPGGLLSVGSHRVRHD